MLSRYKAVYKYMQRIDNPPGIVVVQIQGYDMMKVGDILCGAITKTDRPNRTTRRRQKSSEQHGSENCSES